LDDEYYAKRDYKLEDIEVPLLSVANWGGITLHLRGNVEGYNHARSQYKFIRFITGRHDLPFYYPEEVDIQRGFLDCFLKDDDWAGWKTGKQPKVNLRLRKGDKGVNDAAREKEWALRSENEWPIARTQYTKYYLTSSNGLQLKPPTDEAVLSYKALGNIQDQQLISFQTAPFDTETEITGHVTAHLNLSATKGDNDEATPSELDVFVTLRHLGPDGKEIHYTGAAGDAVPLTKGWLRLSLRKVDETHPRHRHYLPQRNYRSTDVLPVEAGQVYPVDIEIWPTNVTLEPGASLVFEVSSGDTQGGGVFSHDSPVDRSALKLEGLNNVHFGPESLNYVTLPIIPSP
jgi:predicted acyl esterase